MVVATAIKTTTEYTGFSITAMLKPSCATTMPTSPRGTIPQPIRNISVRPSQMAPSPQPMSLERIAAARITRARIKRDSITESAHVQMEADARKEKGNQQFGDAVREIVNALGNGFGKRHSGQKCADNRRYADMDRQHRQGEE